MHPNTYMHEPLRMCHLLVDGYAPTIPSELEVRRLLAEIVTLTSMTPIAKAIVIEHHGGIQGIQIIAESHISVEIMSNHSAAIDVFSCREFDVPSVYQYIQSYLKLEHISMHLIRRGDTLDASD